MAGIAEALRRKASSIKSGAKQDVRKARRAASVDLDAVKRRARQDAKIGKQTATSSIRGVRRSNVAQAASEKKKELKTKAKQDVNAAERSLASLSAKDIVAGAAEASESFSQDMVAGDVMDAPEDDTVADRAREAGEARAPVDADLDPVGDPRALEDFATAAGDGRMESLLTPSVADDEGQQAGGWFEGDSQQADADGLMASEADDDNDPWFQSDSGADEEELGDLELFDAFGAGGDW